MLVKGSNKTQQGKNFVWTLHSLVWQCTRTYTHVRRIVAFDFQFGKSRHARALKSVYHTYASGEVGWEYACVHV